MTQTTFVYSWFAYSCRECGETNYTRHMFNEEKVCPNCGKSSLVFNEETEASIVIDFWSEVN